MDIVFFTVCKKGITSAMELADLAAFTFAM